MGGDRVGYLPERPGCVGSPHLYLVLGWPPEPGDFIEVSEQHCCSDHEDVACLDWVAVDFAAVLLRQAWTEVDG